MDPSEDPEDPLRTHRSREKTFIFDVVFDQHASQVPAPHPPPPAGPGLPRCPHTGGLGQVASPVTSHRASLMDREVGFWVTPGAGGRRPLPQMQGRQVPQLYRVLIHPSMSTCSPCHPCNHPTKLCLVHTRLEHMPCPQWLTPQPAGQAQLSEQTGFSCSRDLHGIKSRSDLVVVIY